jgi:hypothetical protein
MEVIMSANLPNKDHSGQCRLPRTHGRCVMYGGIVEKVQVRDSQKRLLRYAVFRTKALVSFLLEPKRFVAQPTLVLGRSKFIQQSADELQSTNERR